MPGNFIGSRQGMLNANAGRQAYEDGVTKPADVLRRHLAVNKPDRAHLYFAMGYREMAAKAGKPVGDALRYFDWRVSPTEMNPVDLTLYNEIVAEIDGSNS